MRWDHHTRMRGRVNYLEREGRWKNYEGVVRTEVTSDLGFYSISYSISDNYSILIVYPIPSLPVEKVEEVGPPLKNRKIMRGL